MHISDFVKMSLIEQGIWEKLLAKRENFLGYFNVPFGNGALRQSTALKGDILRPRIFWRGGPKKCCCIKSLPQVK
jgi:hypothetical protein